MSWDAYVDSLKQRGMIHGAICGLDGSWFVASDGSKVRNYLFSFNGRVNNKHVRQKKLRVLFTINSGANSNSSLDIIDMV